MKITKNQFTLPGPLVLAWGLLLLPVSNPPRLELRKGGRRRREGG